jgi:type II secretory pathway pseudopilin PulG
MKKSKKRAFTLVELLVVVSFMLIMTAQIYREYQKQIFYDDVNTYMDYLENLIKVAINDPVTGFPRNDADTTNPCGDDNSFIGITAARAFNCAGIAVDRFEKWDPAFSSAGTGPADVQGHLHYAQDFEFLGTHTLDAFEGCHIQLNSDTAFDIPLATNQYLLYIDCSNLTYGGGDPGFKRYIEDKIEYLITVKMQSYFVSMNRQTESIRPITYGIQSGTDDDGIIGFVMQ